MYENHPTSTSTSTSEHAPRAQSSGDAAPRGTDPKFARESFTMRKMLPWQIAALAIAAVVAVALVVFYI
ncbi:MAG TPA: hypothetical protein VMQ83_02990 [Gammaproteobacteria bacterium]|nr:hypothetical protein [Gammaproteobacteria bacterium]